MARRNLAWSIFAEHLGFSVWLIWSVSSAFLLSVGFSYSPQQLFVLVALPNLVGSLLRLPYTLTVSMFGGRNWTMMSAALVAANRPLQDTNDAYLANIQRNGTYSVVPRIPGGEITPARLIVIGEVARDFNLYTKITGGQRIDLFGARMEELPLIWRRLVDAGFESGHAYGKSLRTVKSCVGSTWCRYGVQDSTSLAIMLEERYRGLRSPHKLKGGVSGCARECAEARSKDFGIIATERGWNLYVAGNGGATPVHARLLAGDLDTETLVRYLDRFLMYYIRTASRLQGTTLEDPDKLARFVSFVNAPGTPDPHITFREERDQIAPADSTGPVVLGATIPVGAAAVTR